MVFSLVSSTMHRKNGVEHIYTNEEIDYFVCYNIERDKLFIISVNEASNSQLTIRYTKPKNGQMLGVKFEEDYLLDIFLDKL